MSASSAAWIGSGRPNRGGSGYGYPAAVRDEARRMRAAGLPAEEIARRLGVHKLTVYRWTRGTLDSYGNAYPLAVYEEAVRLRMRAGLTNAQIAERIGVSYKTVWQWLGPAPKRLGGHRPHPTGLHERAMYLRGCGYTVDRISEEMGLPRSTVGDWVRGVAA